MGEGGGRVPAACIVYPPPPCGAETQFSDEANQPRLNYSVFTINGGEVSALSRRLSLKHPSVSRQTAAYAA